MITAVVLTKNEENNIEECIKTLKWCDEIVVIDDNSKDQTIKIAKKLGVQVFIKPLNGDFAAQRNFGLKKVKSGDWVLFVDADERVSPELANEIKTEVASLLHLEGGNEAPPRDTTDGFFIFRRDVMWGKELKYGEFDIKLLRLARKHAGVWKRKVHEVWAVQGKTKTLNNLLLHFPHPTINEFLVDIDHYSTLHAHANYKEGKRSSILKILIFPKLKFFNNLILKYGFLDGTHGFVLALLMSFHSYLAWSKLWLYQKNPNTITL